MLLKKTATMKEPIASFIYLSTSIILVLAQGTGEPKSVMPPSKALDLPFGKPIRKRSQSRGAAAAAHAGVPPPSHGEPCGSSSGTDVPGHRGKTGTGGLRTATGDGGTLVSSLALG